MDIVAAERRRSDRLWLTIPLRVRGVDSKGDTIEFAGRAISLNRHGGLIQVPQELPWGRLIRLRNSIENAEAEFRVVETMASNGEVGWEYGVECVAEKNNFWGIQFPSSRVDVQDAKALLQCGLCHTKALMLLTISDIARLGTDGMTGKYCAKCSAMTHWWYADMSLTQDRGPERPRSSIEMKARWITPLNQFAERGHPRVHMQMPLWIRGHYGDSDEVRTENISKIGFSFSSERKYLRGEIVRTAFPVAPMTQNFRMPARIVREQDLKGSARRIYGAAFEPPTSFKPLAVC